jgi:hypothetical protein
LQPAALPDGGEGLAYQVRPECLPETYYSLAAFHCLQGFPVGETRLGRWRVRDGCKAAVAEAAGYFDATRLDRRCAGDLRLKNDELAPGMTAAELLVFGTGMLRAACYSSENAADLKEHGRITTPLEVVFTRIGALRSGVSGSGSFTEKELYYSTNLIYGDALGELEQLWDRRADVEFLDRVARHLSAIAAWTRYPAPAQAPLNFELVMKLHLRSQAVWRKPPASGRALLRRIEFLLEHTLIDDTPRTQYRVPTRAASGEPPTGPRGHWQRDESGYDGWLPEAGTALN